MEKLESSSLGGVAVVILLAVIALSRAVVFVPRRLLSSGCTTWGAGGISLVSLLAFRLMPKDQVRPAFLRKFALDGCKAGAEGGRGACVSSCRRDAVSGFTFLSERLSTEEGFVDELLSRVDEAALSY